MSHEEEKKRKDDGGKEKEDWKIADCTGGEAEGDGGGGRRKWNSSSERVTLAGKSKDENNRAIKKTR